MLKQPSATTSEEIEVPFSRVTGLVRQLTHDVRNGLNNIDLQSAFLQELTSDPQMAAEVKRLRGMVGDAAKMLREFSAKFWLPTANSVTYSAMAFIEDFRHRLGLILPETAPKVHWTVTLRKESVSVDLEMLTRALIEVFRNTSDFREGDRSAEARVSAAEGHLVIELLESKSSVPSAPEAWGREPLVSTRRSGFGMGLYYTRRVLQGHGGEIAAEFDAAAKRLTTRITLPLAEV